MKAEIDQVFQHLWVAHYAKCGLDWVGCNDKDLIAALAQVTRKSVTAGRTKWEPE